MQLTKRTSPKWTLREKHFFKEPKYQTHPTKEIIRYSNWITWEIATTKTIRPKVVRKNYVYKTTKKKSIYTNIFNYLQE